ncbi:EAL domain-containing protein [Porticoccaceae bacterium LTM1]|nr:EAL domain-containing protein [Porticoccaceae bacterium LTM1]
MLAVMTLFVCISPLLLQAASISLDVDADIVHTLIAWSGVMAVALTSILALTHFGIDPDDYVTPLIGIGLLAFCVVEGFAVLQNSIAGSDGQFMVNCWMACRYLLPATLLLIGVHSVVMMLWGQAWLSDREPGSVVVIYMVLLAVFFSVLSTIPRIILALPETLQLIFPFTCLLLSSPLLVVTALRAQTQISAAVVLMLLPLLLIETNLLFGSGQLLISDYLVVSVLQSGAVLVPMAALIIQFIKTYHAVEGAKRELVINQKKLDVALETLTRSNERLRHANSHDHLTGVANREFFFEEAERAIARAQRNNHSVGFFYIDLDKFKQVNDTYGHSVGDEVLCCVTERIRGVTRTEDCLARVGGDEFVLMVENVGQSEELGSVAEKIMEVLQPPVHTSKGELDVPISIGISSFPHSQSVADLVKYADVAMYEAKSNETSRYQLYTRELSIQHAENLELQRELPEALGAGELSLVYQPIFISGSRTPMGVEALVRWNHPEKGAISPGKFIPIAEKSTFINNLGIWVFEQACRQLSAWRQKGLKLAIGVNVSVRQLYTDTLVHTIRRCLLEYCIPAEDITLEITEGQLIQDLQACQGTIQALKQLGVTIALDDYGSGFASITHLRNLPIDFLKIDRSLIRNAPHNSQNRVLTRTTIELAHSLNLPVVAEGVEEQEELDLVEAYRCDFVQGYFLAKPMDGMACTEFLMGSSIVSESEAIKA